MTKQKTALVSVNAGVGHVNACVAVGQRLLDSGNYRVVFAISELLKGKLKAYSFEEALIPEDIPEVVDPVKCFAKKLLEMGMLTDQTPIEMLKHSRKGPVDLVQLYKKLDKDMEQVISDVKPDVILIDHLFCVPSVELSGIPLVWVWSSIPLFLNDDDERLPPGASGYSVNGNRDEWKVYRELKYEANISAWNEWNDYIVLKGCPPLRDNSFITAHKWLTVYGYPKEIDYTDIVPMAKNYIQFDNLMRRENNNIEKFEIPEQLKDKPGKLIYFSMGSMGAVNVENMKRLCTILAKSKHRFIVSKGPKHDEYDLPDNMWGQSTVPQVSVLPLVDLVITHGGNNTITETFNYGKPMIVLPLFYDQFDNAQRLQDLGLGIRLNTYKCTDEEMLTAIEKLLNDNELNEKY
ncbi:NDP-glycosyltransferase YjiC-like [Oppia nitens]|uniref:NDP-glycosyltransferase YjiC-like n=1 Tax=Oppia nitens TaxID=1686743 RepID=UPI0023DB2F1E|nr:NDP-glycosyltransferase YjiC-like [Oppia nitens]